MNEQSQIRVFSVDDHPLLREGIAAIINNQPDMLMVAQASTGSIEPTLIEIASYRRMVDRVSC